MIREVLLEAAQKLRKCQEQDVSPAISVEIHHDLNMLQAEMDRILACLESEPDSAA